MPTVAVLIGAEPAHRHSVHRAYADAVWASGATPLLIPAPRAGECERLVQAALACDAVMLTGGGDVDPSIYGEKSHPSVMAMDSDRDAADIATAMAARQIGRPVLGICRGIQVLAVAFGGRLCQHLPDAGFNGHWDEDRQYEPVHRVHAENGSMAAQVLPADGRVNSIHHQGVLDGGELRATAWCDDGLIEALEGERILGVQWHPERLFAANGGSLDAFRWLTQSTVTA